MSYRDFPSLIRPLVAVERTGIVCSTLCTRSIVVIDTCSMDYPEDIHPRVKVYSMHVATFSNQPPSVPRPQTTNQQQKQEHSPPHTAASVMWLSAGSTVPLHLLHKHKNTIIHRAGLNYESKQNLA